MRKLIRLMRWLIEGQMGINFGRVFRVIRGSPRFFKDAVRFRRNYHGKLQWLPCLTDWYEEGGSARGEYFWQDLYVARRIFDAKPQRHIDIGSRVDGFVAHVASFRQVEVFDIRPIPVSIPGIVFRQADLMQLDETLSGCCDSLSCLHALEHFGLGRYGDPLDQHGHEAGMRNMARLLSAKGVFYLSVPIGIARVQFNAHRIFDPHEIMKIAAKNRLFLDEFAFVSQGDKLIESVDPEQDFRMLACNNYALGIFVFKKE